MGNKHNKYVALMNDFTSKFPVFIFKSVRLSYRPTNRPGISSRR